MNYVYWILFGFTKLRNFRNKASFCWENTFVITEANLILYGGHHSNGNATPVVTHKKNNCRKFQFWSFSDLFSGCWRFSIMQIRSVMTSYCLQLKMVKYWIDDISGNIEAVFLKLGTINVHHKRNKMTPSMVLP